MHPRDLPHIQSLLDLTEIQNLSERYSRGEVVSALRGAIEGLRVQLLAAEIDSLPDFCGSDFQTGLVADIEKTRAASLRRVINATGILIHTNLGRSRLADQAIAAMQAAAAHPNNLELDLTRGKRGSRHTHVEALICELTGAEAAVVVNNCAAAVLLSLMATASGKKVVASRGELIEIGGSFRLPDVIEQSGAILKEVGATNKTRVSDYANGIDDETAVLLKSHTSNFKIVGFTSSPERRDLAKLARDRGVILMEDLGSGVLIDLAPFGLPDEPVVSDILKAGVDLVMFSGDKLLGGPQAGIIAGKSQIIARLKSHPLMRAVRLDKLSIAALEATLRLYRAPYDATREIPVLAMLAQDILEIGARAKRLKAGLFDMANMAADIEQSLAYVGGGTLPEQDLQSVAVAISHKNLSAEKLSAVLRGCSVPVIARIEKGRVVLDMRTVTDADVPLIVEALNEISQG